MSSYLVTAELTAASNTPEDSVVNSFAIASDMTFADAQWVDVFNAVSEFYNGSTGQTRAVAAYLGSSLSRATGGVKLKGYDLGLHLDGSAHGSPVAEDSTTLGAPVDNSLDLPRQSAAVLTLRARGAITKPVEGAGNTRPRERYTGRIFLGPLNATAINWAFGVPLTLAASFRTDCCIAGERLQDALVDGDYQWGVWSRTREAITPIVRVEMDNSPDVIRKRKASATARTVRDFSPVPSLILGA